MAGSFNKVILMGNIVKDPELRYTPQGTAVTDIRLAINDPRAKGGAQDRANTATFVDVTLWDRSAEVVCEYLRKGRPILIEGRLVTDTWDDRDTGKKMSKLKVIAQSFQFVDGREGGGENGGNYEGGEGASGGARSGEGSYSSAPRGGRPPAGGQGAPAGGQGGYGRSQPRQQSSADDFDSFPADGGGDDIPF